MAEQEPENTANEAQDQTSGSSPIEEPAEVDLAREAESAAADDAAPKAKSRSLEELDLTDAQRAQVEAIVSKSVNDAVAKHDRRAQRKAKEEGNMTRAQVEALLAEKEAETSRRLEARDRFLEVLGEHGIAPGSDAYRKVGETFKQGVDDENFTPQILTTRAGINTLVALAGVSKPAEGESTGPRTGLPTAGPEGSVIHQDGTIQLNAKGKDDDLSLQEQMRRAMSDSLRPNT